ncbi:MAG: hypothetical protein P8Y03_09775 [Anaerolineales bacterium]
MKPLHPRTACIMFILCLLLAGCGAPSDLTPTPPAVVSSTSQPSQTTSPTGISPSEIIPTSSPTISTPVVVLSKPAESSLSQADQIESTLAALSEAAGYRFQVRQSLSREDLGAEFHLVVALPPNPGLSDLAAAAPRTQFIGVGISGLEPHDNLTLIDPQGTGPDEIGFVAGYIAAVATPEWRVGDISASDTASGIAARNGFLNGVVYFCGLCRQTYPPFYDYPLYVELPSGSDQAEWQAAADVLRDKFVKSVYVSPEASSEALLNYLAQSDLNIIGNSQPPEAIQGHWVTSIQSDYINVLNDLWTEVLGGNGGRNVSVGLKLDAINADLFSPGRQRLVEDLLKDLQGGYVDTGVDPLTGELR